LQQCDERRVVIPYHVAGVYHHCSGAPGDGSNDIREAELQLRLGDTGAVCLGGAYSSFDRSLIGMKRGAGRVTGGDKLIHALPGNDTKRAEFPRDLCL